MRKRSSYRPKARYANPVDAVIERLTPVRAHTGYLVDLKIKNHGALASLMQGKATREDISTLMAMSNMCEALVRQGVGAQFTDVMQAGFAAVRDAAQRFAAAGRVTLYAREIAALNEFIELHDAQMEVITVQDLDRALKCVIRDAAAGRIERIHTEVPA
jgi:hypothetical protein